VMWVMTCLLVREKPFLDIGSLYCYHEGGAQISVQGDSIAYSRRLCRACPAAWRSHDVQFVDAVLVCPRCVARLSSAYALALRVSTEARIVFDVWELGFRIGVARGLPWICGRGERGAALVATHQKKDKANEESNAYGATRCCTGDSGCTECGRGSGSGSRIRWGFGAHSDTTLPL
jgi:hypothetical protein